jgi:pinin
LYENDFNYSCSSDAFMPPNKRRASDDVGLLPDDGVFEDETNKSSDVNTVLKSSVSAAPIPPRPTTNSSSDNASKLRNRRMFGMLMGTLQKFQKDSSQITEQEKRRVQIETKLEEEAIKEREEATQHKMKLLDQKREQQQLVGKLTNQLELAELYEEWNIHHKLLYGFIKTSSQPSLYYLPAIHNNTTEELLKQSQTELLGTL